MPLKLVPDGARWSDPDTQLYAGQTLMNEMHLRRNVQDVRLRMQDAWLLLYLMVDLVQDAAPSGRQRHYTNRVPAIVDTARRVLSQNPLKYHVISGLFPNDPSEERMPFRRLENVYHGLLYDIDRQQRMQGKRSSRAQTAFHSLVRGAWAYKLQLTSQSGSPTGSPLFYAQLDPRQVLPVFSYSGLDSAIAWDVVSFNQLYYRYQDVLSPVMDRLFAKARKLSRYGSQTDMSWMHAPIEMVEWSSGSESAVMIDLTQLPPELCQDLGLHPDWPNRNRYVWLQPPQDLGFGKPIIQYGNVNGVDASLPTREAAMKFASSPFARYPLYRGGSGTDGTVGRSPLYMLTAGSNGMAQSLGATIDPMGALAGRSLYANVAHLIPEYNDFTALLADAVYQEVRGTWLLKTRSGQMFEVAIGTGEVNAVQLGEDLAKVNMQIATPDAAMVLDRINQEVSDGSLDLRFILAAEQDSGGYLRQRMEQAALGQLDDYKVGLQNWGESLADSFNTQYRVAHKQLGDWKLQGRTPGKMTSFFVIDLDDMLVKALTEKEPPVVEAVVKAQLPIDMMAKINMAKSAIDPSNPVMGLRMALDMILEVDDADPVFDQILEDIGNRNPTLQLMKIAQVFIENGAEPLAQMIMRDEFRSAFAQHQAANSGAGGTPPATSTPAGASPGIASSTMPPEATTASGTEQVLPRG